MKHHMKQHKMKIPWSMSCRQTGDKKVHINLFTSHAWPLSTNVFQLLSQVFKPFASGSSDCQTTGQWKKKSKRTTSLNRTDKDGIWHKQHGNNESQILIHKNMQRTDRELHTLSSYTDDRDTNGHLPWHTNTRRLPILQLFTRPPRPRVWQLLVMGLFRSCL